MSSQEGAAMIDVEQVRKTFDGRQALDDFTLRVAAGTIFGLVGPNGAGKTTLMKVLSTLVSPSSGTARVNGLDVTTDGHEVKRILGYMPDQPGVYQDMSVLEFFEFFAGAFQIKGSRGKAAVDRALERSGLADRRRSSVEQLSFGMKQRLVLAKTLLHQPKVLLLDEPATGLDPIARIELRSQLRQLQAEGMTILISSHILSDLEDICTQVALIGAGRNTTDAEGHSVLQMHAPEPRARRYEIEVLGDPLPAVQIVNSIAGTRLLESDSGRLVVEIAGPDEQVAALLRSLVVAGVNVLRFDHRALGLEERYRLAFQEQRP
jgi:ABC-2 type transport system ATP-binding protein